MAEREALGPAVSVPEGRLARLRRLDGPERRALLAHHARRRLQSAWWRLRDAARASYALDGRGEGGLAARLPATPVALLDPCAEAIRAASARFLEHRFDLLGSGWVRVEHGMQCGGLDGRRFPEGTRVAPDPAGDWLGGRVNSANLPEARRLWRMTGPGYVPIDWQIDFRSGYRWNGASPSSLQKPGPAEGADIKVPWELGRLQHLAQLAHAYRLAGEGRAGFEAPERYRDEFRDQVLDFLAANPPRFGVQWASSMDVGLRAASLATAWDLFAAAGAAFDAQFGRVFARALREHGAHLERTLDWHPRYRANHYLCGVAGLLFAAEYLPACGESGRWRAMALRTLRKEADRQFLPDGGNFEASTGYHRLSGEALIYASSLAAGEFPPRHGDCVARIAAFIRASARPDGLSPQIGDQDSGRFLKLSARLQRTAGGDWEEELRDHRHVVAAAGAYLGDANLLGDLPAEWQLEASFVAGFAKGRTRRGAAPQPEVARTFGDPKVRDAMRERLLRFRPPQRARYEFPFPAGERISAAFPDFGLFVVRAGDSYVAIRCGPVGLNGLGAHAHNDALSLELVVEGRDVVRDPGSYVYTPLPEERDRYRSVRAHFAPRISGREPARLGPGPFRLGEEAQPRCLYFGPDGFLGMHIGYGQPVYRLVTLADRMLAVEDFSEGEALEPIVLSQHGEPEAEVSYSPRYGVRAR
jgi:hypothetical protein